MKKKDIFEVFASIIKDAVKNQPKRNKLVFLDEKISLKSDLKKLVIQSDNADVWINSSSDNMLHCLIVGNVAENSTPNVDIALKNSGDTFNIDVFDKTKPDAQVSIMIEVPMSIFYIKLLNENGDVKLKSVSLKDGLLADLNNGDIDIKECQITDILAKNHNGDICLKNIDCDKCSLKSCNGDIIIKEVNSKTKIITHTSNGDIIRN